MVMAVGAGGFELDLAVAAQFGTHAQACFVVHGVEEVLHRVGATAVAVKVAVVVPSLDCDRYWRK